MILVAKSSSRYTGMDSRPELFNSTHGAAHIKAALNTNEIIVFFQLLLSSNCSTNIVINYFALVFPLKTSLLPKKCHHW